MRQPNYRHGFQVSLHEPTLELSLGWRKPQVIFVSSMSDIFHDEIPEGYIQRVFEVMRQPWQHTFQVLTKRAERLDLKPPRPARRARARRSRGGRAACGGPEVPPG